MGILSVKPIPEGGGATLKGGFEQDSELRWRITTDTVYWDGLQLEPLTAGVTIGGHRIPLWLDPHPNKSSHTARSLNYERQGRSKYHWIATVKYSAKPLDQEKKDEQTQSNPLQRPARIRWESLEYEEAVLEDKDGKPLLTSAGEQYDAQVRVRTDWIAHVTKNVQVVPAWIMTVDEPTNSAQFTIDGKTVGQGKGKLKGISIGENQEEIVNDVLVVYREFSFSIHVRKRGWKLRLPDAGYQYLKDGKLTEILVEDDDGNKVRPTSPQFLNGEGELLDTPIDPEQVAWNEFEMDDELDFSDLPLT